MVRVGVCAQLPVEGVSMILGNDLAGGKVLVGHNPQYNDVQCLPEMIKRQKPEQKLSRIRGSESDLCDKSFTKLFWLFSDRA